jgi:hypothetical protein
MVDKIKTVYPHCDTNCCIDSDNRDEFIVCDTSSGKAIIHRGTNTLCHPFLSISNKKNKEIRLLAIDACILFPKDGEKCDCAVFDDLKFCFVEIKKNQGANPEYRRLNREKAISQLLTTIEVFKQNIDFSTHITEAVLCVGHKDVRPAASATSSDLKAQFLKKPYHSKLLDGSQIIF